MVVVTALNSTESWRAHSLLSTKHVHDFADVEVIAAGCVFPAHRAVLAAHSIRFRDAFVAERHAGDAAFAHLKAAFECTPLPRRQLLLELPQASDDVLRAGWTAVYRYCYGLRVPLDTGTALAAVQVSREYRFDELTVVLDAYLRGGGAVDPKRCTRVFAAAAAASRAGAPRGYGGGSADVLNVVRAAAWRVMRERFAEVEDWHVLPWAYMVRLVKLNDLQVSSELDVLRAVECWIKGAARGDEDAVLGLAKLVRFPTMTRAELSQAAASPLVSAHPGVMRYIRRGIAARDMTERPRDLLDAPPTARRRRMDALTFSDRVSAWSTLAKPVQTSTRYFAGALWRVVVDPAPSGVGLYLAVLSEESHSQVDVSIDFSLFIVNHETDAEGRPVLVRKQANAVRFTHSGQRAGFANMASRAELDDARSALLRQDTLCVGVSLRLRNCVPSSDAVPGITLGADDTAELLRF